MQKKYYIQVGDQQAIDIWDQWGIRIVKTEGLTQLPPLKKPFSYDWKDEQGDDEYVPDDLMFESKEITITFRIDKDSQIDLISKIKDFRKTIFSSNRLSYFDTYKNEGFSGRYLKEDIKDEKYREYTNFVEFEMDFAAPNGICWGYNNSEYTSINVYITKGYADVYFSDGSSVLNLDESITKDQEGGFAIICPSIYGGVDLEVRTNKIFGINGKIFGTEPDYIRTGKTYGI